MNVSGKSPNSLSLSANTSYFLLLRCSYKVDVSEHGRSLSYRSTYGDDKFCQRLVLIPRKVEDLLTDPVDQGQ